MLNYQRISQLFVSPLIPHFSNEELIQVAEEGPVHMGNSNKSHPHKPWVAGLGIEHTLWL